MAVQTPVFLPPNVDKDGKEIKMDFGKIEQWAIGIDYSS
jgi:hypothetical protein